jgi:hypothetical protein
MAATLHVGLCDVTMHEAAHYFMKVMVNAGDGPAGSNPPTERKDKKPDRTEVFTRSNTPAFKTSDFELPVRVEGGTLRDDELELGAFAVIRTDPKDGDAAVNKATSKLVGVVRRRLADLAVALAAGPVSEPFVLLHPDGREVGQGTMVLRIELPPGAPALRATAEQRDGACYELVLRNGVNCSALAAAGSGGVVVVVSTQVRGMVGAELARSAPAVIGALTHWNQTLLLRPPAPLEASDAVVVALRPAAGGAAAAELARATLPLGLLRDEAPRDVRLLVAEPSGVALHLSLRRLPPAVATAAALELELRQLRPGAPGLSLGAPGLSLPPAGTVLVAVRYGSLAEYTPGALPWRHTPAAAAGADALARALGAPPPLADARTVTWAREGGEWPAAFRWALESRTATPSAGAGVALELYAPEATTAGGAGGAGGGCEWRLWAHATLPVPAELREARVSASAAFEVPLVLARAVAALPGASPAPLLAGSLRWLAPTDAAQPRASAPAPRADASAPPSAALVSATGGGGGGNAHVASGASGGGAPAAALLAELEQKQALINRLLRDVDARTAALARCGHELVTLRDRHAGLEAAHTRAARELAEKDKVLDRLAHDAAQSEHIDPIELARRHRLLGGAYRTEKTRSDELARQLTVLSERVGTAGRLETAYVSLQVRGRAGPLGWAGLGWVECMHAIRVCARVALCVCRVLCSRVSRQASLRRLPLAHPRLPARGTAGHPAPARTFSHQSERTHPLRIPPNRHAPRRPRRARARSPAPAGRAPRAGERAAARTGRGGLAAKVQGDRPRAGEGDFKT